MTDSDLVTHTLDVPGARLYYERRGVGPLLLLFPGDHGGFAALPEQCARVLDQVLTQTA